MAKKRRPTRKLPQRARLLSRNRAEAMVARLVQQQEHSLLREVKIEPNERRRRFLFALYQALPDLTADEMDRIEPHLTNAIGRVAAARDLNNLLRDITERLNAKLGIKP